MTTSTIQKWGNSQGIRIPKHILNELKWHNNEAITIKAENEKIIIEKLKQDKRKNINELFADFDGQYTATEIDWGKAVGKEIW